MSIYITKDGKKRKVNISATDVQLLDIDGRFKNKNLEDALKEVGSGTEENMTRIEEKVEEHTAQLKDVANEVSQISNLNLLINGDFKINQRSETTYTIIGTSKYTIDRWISYNLTSDTTEITTLDNGIKVKSKSGGSGRLRQWLEPDDTKKLVGKTVTFSIKVTEDCTQCVFSVVKNKELNGDVKVFSNIKKGDILSHTFKVTSDFTQLGVQFSTIDTNGIIVEYAKLELGSVATPFAPRPFGEELALCQRYYETLGGNEDRVNLIGFYENSSIVTFPYMYKVNKRIVPTITTNGGFRFFPSGFETNINFIETNTKQTRIQASTSGLPAGASCGLQSSDTGGNILFDAEIY